MFKPKNEPYFPPLVPFDVQIYRKIAEEHQRYLQRMREKRTTKKFIKNTMETLV